MKTNLTLLFLLLFSISFAQTNLLESSTWPLGPNGSVSIYNRNGDTNENVRVNGISPYGENAVLWEAVNDADSNPDGGWNTSYTNIDNNKSYRFSVWIKKTNSDDGYTYFGFRSQEANAPYDETTIRVNGETTNNPYFFVGDLPELNKWYLLVGYIHEKSHTQTNSIGAVYDGETKLPVATLTDYKFTSESIRVYHRTYLYWDTNINDRQYFYAPTIYEVNGQEPTIEELLGNTNSDSNSPTTSVWSQSGNTINYTGGNVGIGTTTPAHVLDVKTSGVNFKTFNYGVEQTVNTTGGWARAYRFRNENDNVAAVFGSLKGSAYISTGFDVTDDGTGYQNQKFTVSRNGNVGIGTTTPDAKLTVKGNIHTQEVKVDLQGAVAPDYVFKEDYNLRSLEQVDAYIKENGHLPNIPSAAEMEKEGVLLKEMNLKLLEKIEELTLYVIELKKEVEELKK